MALTNNLKRSIDLPVFEWTRFAPSVSAGTTCTEVAENSLYNVQHGRYIYYLVSSALFWRYDTWSDSWTELSSPITALAVWSTMQFLSEYGFEGRVLSGSATTVQIPTYYGKVLRGFD